MAVCRPVVPDPRLLHRYMDAASPGQQSGARPRWSRRHPRPSSPRTRSVTGWSLPAVRAGHASAVHRRSPAGVGRDGRADRTGVAHRARSACGTARRRRRRPRTDATRLPARRLAWLGKHYGALIAEGEQLNPPPPGTGKRRPTGARPRGWLLIRLATHRAEALRFATDFRDPFDNYADLPRSRSQLIQQQSAVRSIHQLLGWYWSGADELLVTGGGRCGLLLVSPRLMSSSAAMTAAGSSRGSAGRR